jgi:amylovoran biosynthesis glycosyltransferase AmsB
MTLRAGSNDSVSVIVPCFEGSRYIAELLACLETQTLCPTELILVDDCSSDIAKTQEIISDQQGAINYQIILIKNSQKSNAAACRNIGISRAKSNFIAFLDCDDLWRSDKLETQLKLLAPHSDTHICYSKVSETLNGDAISIRPQRGKKHTQSVANYLFASDGFMQTSSLVCHRRIANKILFNEQFPRHQDYDFCIRAEKLGFEFLFLPKALTIYRRNAIFANTNNLDPNYSAWWLTQMREYLSPFEQACFIINVIGVRFINQKNFSAFFSTFFSVPLRYRVEVVMKSFPRYFFRLLKFAKNL